MDSGRAAASLITEFIRLASLIFHPPLLPPHFPLPTHPQPLPMPRLSTSVLPPHLPLIPNHLAHQLPTTLCLKEALTACSAFQSHFNYSFIASQKHWLYSLIDINLELTTSTLFDFEDKLKIISVVSEFFEYPYDVWLPNS